MHRLPLGHRADRPRPDPHRDGGRRDTRTATPGQTVGPFFGYALPYAGGAAARAAPTAPAPSACTAGCSTARASRSPTLCSSSGRPIAEGRVPAAAGSLRRDGWTFTGWGRAPTDNVGQYSFTTLTPGGPTPFFALTVFARGLLDRLFTRVYLPDDVAASALLSELAPERRRTLIAAPDRDGFRFDIVLQGENETTFLSYRERG